MKRQILLTVSSKEFVTHTAKPLIADDTNAYEILLQTPYDLTGATFSITAFRPDGVTISDVGSVDGSTATYTMKNNMHSVTGETRFRLTLVKETTSLTETELLCNVVSENGSPNLSGEDRVPALQALIGQAGTAVENANAALAAANESVLLLGNLTEKAEDMEESLVNINVLVAADNSTDYDKKRATFVCTGAADQAVISQAIALLSNGGTVQLCAGDYYLSLQNGALLTLGSNITLKGVYYGKTVIHAPEYTEGCETTCAVSMGDGCVVEDLTLINSAEYIAYDMVGYSPIIAIGNGIVLRNLYIELFASSLYIGDASTHSDILIDNVSTRLTDSISISNINRLIVQNSRIATNWVRDYNEGIHMFGCTDATIKSCIIDEPWGTGIRFYGQKAVFTGNTITSTLDINGSNVTISNNVIITGNDLGITGSNNKIHSNTINKAENISYASYSIAGERVQFYGNQLACDSFYTRCPISQINQNILYGDWTIFNGGSQITHNLITGSIVDTDMSGYNGNSSNYLIDNYHII